jgi:hypothetical protein
MKKFFLLLAVAFAAFAAQATEWTAADGTDLAEYAPVYGYNFETDQHNQMQYPAAELTGMAAGTEITALKFYTSTIDLVNGLGGTVTVSLANMDDVTPWSPDAWGGISGDLLDVAVTAVATVTPAADEDGVWTITFNAPFTYTGGALLIDVQSVAGDYKDTYFYGKEMGSYLIMSTYGWAGSTKGDTKLPKATFVYDGGGIANLSEANALEDAAEFTFNGDAVVTAFTTYQGVSYMFVRDETGYGMFAGVDGTFENGQVLNQGWNATKTSVNDWVRFIDATGLSTSGETNAELAAAQKLTGAADVNESMINAFVYVENQKSTFAPRSYTLPDGTTIARTEVLGGINWSMGKALNVYGVICKVDGTLKLNPLFTELYVEPQPEGLRGDVDDDQKVDINDVTALIDYLLGTNPNINMDNADCDLDDDILIDDVTVLIDFLLTGVWPE